MRLTLLTTMAALAALLSGARAAPAQDEMQFASSTEIAARLEKYEQRIAELEAADMGGDGCGCDDCCMDPCCRSCGIVGGAEVAFLRPHSTIGIGDNFGGVSFVDVEYDFETTPRLWVGYQGSNGLGARLRYWEFDHSQAQVGGDVFSAFHSLDTYVVDAEVTDTTALGCNWDATVFGGLRYVDYVETRSPFITATGATLVIDQYNSDSIGPTAGGELRWCVRENFALFGIARGSILMGSQDEFTANGPGPLGLVDHESNNIFYITELQLGGELTRPLADGGYGFARLAVEAQNWSNFSQQFGGGDSGNMGFAGFTAAVGIVR